MFSYGLPLSFSLSVTHSLYTCARTVMHACAFPQFDRRCRCCSVRWWWQRGGAPSDGMEPGERKQLEKAVREVVADAESPTAQRYIRETLKKNKFTSALMLLALLAPSAFLFSFYYAKMAAIRENWRDPYELPPGFDPKTGRFDSDDTSRRHAELPCAIVLKGAPGCYREGKGGGNAGS